MAATTVTPDQWPRLLYRPPPTAAAPAVEALPQMQLDDLHYTRQMLLCRGAGYSLSQCSRILQPDTRLTPPNPTEDLYKEEALATVTCLAENGGSRERCRYFIERWHHMLNHEKPPEPGLLQKALHFSKKVLGLRTTTTAPEGTSADKEAKKR